MPDIQIASLADAAGISVIEERCFSRPWSEKSISDLIQNTYSLVIVLRENGICTGYTGAILIADDCEITNIAVLPEFRRHGAASELLSRLISEAKERGAECLILEVRESNVAAMTLYENFGFIPEGRRKNYYTAPTEDAIILKKYLSR